MKFSAMDSSRSSLQSCNQSYANLV